MLEAGELNQAQAILAAKSGRIRALREMKPPQLPVATRDTSICEEQDQGGNSQELEAVRGDSRSVASDDSRSVGTVRYLFDLTASRSHENQLSTEEDQLSRTATPQERRTASRASRDGTGALRGAASDELRPGSSRPEVQLLRAAPAPPDKASPEELEMEQQFERKYVQRLNRLFSIEDSAKFGVLRVGVETGLRGSLEELRRRACVGGIA